MAEALHPGEIDRVISISQRLIKWALKRYCSKSAEHIGYDDAFAEASVGAMHGVVAWLLNNGPGDSSLSVNTYIVRGVRYHFGTGFNLWIGPIRVTKRVYTSTKRKLRFTLCSGEWEEGEDFPFYDDESEKIEFETGEEAAIMSVKILAAADAVDPSRDCRRMLIMRFGLTGNPPMSFSEMAERLGVTKQAIQSRMARFMNAIRNHLEPYDV